MPQRSWRRRGFSLAEMLVVLVIVAILSGAAALMIGDRRGSAVRGVMDEIEGVLYNAQKSSFNSSRDIIISTQGTWANGSLILDGRPLQPGAMDLTPGNDEVRVGSPSECFRVENGSRDHQVAAVVVNDGETAGWYRQACGAAPPLETVEPIVSNQAFVDAIGNPLFSGGLNSLAISGLSKRFTTGFCVVVVGIRAGAPVPNGPVGILVVPVNSSTIYKYYKSEDSDQWRLQ